MDKEKENRWDSLTTGEKNRFETWKEGQKLRFPSENKELGIKAGEVAQVREMDRESVVVKLQKENGQEVAMNPEYMKREMERKALEEEKNQKTIGQKKEDRNEATKEQDRGREREQDVFRERQEDRTERRQEKERKKRRKGPGSSVRERVRDGMGY